MLGQQGLNLFLTTQEGNPLILAFGEEIARLGGQDEIAHWAT